MEVITKYRADDGTEFFSQEECLEYEKQREKITTDTQRRIETGSAPANGFERAAMALANTLKSCTKQCG